MVKKERCLSTTEDDSKKSIENSNLEEIVRNDKTFSNQNSVLNNSFVFLILIIGVVLIGDPNFSSSNVKIGGMLPLLSKNIQPEKSLKFLEEQCPKFCAEMNQ